MADDTVLVSLQQLKPIKIVKWKVGAGCTVSIGRVILLYDVDGVQESEQRKLKSSQAGTVHELIAPEGAVVRSGEPLLRLRACIHPTVMKDMCAECGADLRKEETSRTASVPMVHSIPELKVSEEVAQKLGKADGERLIRDRKLVLLVDLDQTLIHTTNDNIPPNIKDVYHFQLYGPHSPWYHTRLRPGTHNFLSNISALFELHICTFGARNYAHMIAMFLDNDQAFFANRILSRDECFDPTSKKANLRSLFPCGDDMVCIIDDREDVWNHASNLIHVKPYHFFKHTGDINAPPGLDKHEADHKEGVDLSNIKKTKLNGKNVKDVKDTEDTSSESNGVDSESLESTCKTDCSSSTESSGNTDNSSTTENLSNTEKSRNTPEAETADSVPIVEEVKTNGECSHITSKTEAEDADENSKQISVVNDSTNKDVIEEEVNSEKAPSSDEKIDEESSPTDEKMDEESSPTDENSTEAPQKVQNTSETDQPKEPEPDTKEKSSPNKAVTNLKDKDDDLVEIEDSDDYLLYLEDILKSVHKRFYEEYDKLEAGRVPDLKVVIPAVRSEILKGCKLVFSGLVPTHIKLEQSKAYQVARSLGAIVSQDIDDESTHLVAVRPGTAKVNAGRRKKHLKIVTPDWLWACAERWERIEEAIYPLNSKGSKNRHPPPHCSSPEHVPNYPLHDQPATRKRTPSGRFMDTINPLMSFSSADIADMDKEVGDILDDETDSDNDNDADNEGNNDAENETENVVKVKNKGVDTIQILLKEDGNSSSSDESLTAETPRGFKRSREDDSKNKEKSEPEDDCDSTLDEFPNAKIRREDVSTDVDEDQESNSEVDEEDQESNSDVDEPQDDPEDGDDGELDLMGAALEREFLSNE